MNSTPDKIKPAVIGGAAAGVLSAIPFVNCLNCFCCALVIGGGFFAAWLYLKDQQRPAQPPYAEGAIIGVLAGAVAAVAATITSLPMLMIQKAMGLDNSQQMREIFAQADMPPELQGMLEGVVAGGGMEIGALPIGFFFNLFIYGFFSTLGGVLGAAVLHNKMPAGPAAGAPSYGPPPGAGAPPPPPPASY